MKTDLEYSICQCDRARIYRVTEIVARQSCQRLATSIPCKSCFQPVSRVRVQSDFSLMRAVKLTRGYGSNSETYFPLGETTTSALSFTPA
jgi:hypothetical protein